NSASGVTDMARVERVLGAMAEADMPLLVHGEVVDAAVDVFDREQVFVERVLAPLIERHPRLRVVLEHVTTREAVEFVERGPETLAATITAHHLLLNRNAIFAGGLRPHHYCLPVLKRERHREALIEAATGDNPRFFLGTDSAPHARTAKEAACGCAGIYTAHAGVELYAAVFAAAGRLEALEDFASRRGPAFYRLPCNAERIALVAEPWQVPESYAFGDDRLVPFLAGEEVAWRLATT
ncbi:MAG: dihydroorotase, partial [Gammaproteobacteria bacterium]|nr:dihydroorotase [Gammaproteobacteria bacterium]